MQNNYGSKEELIEILQFIRDKVIVTGSYAENRQTAESDIDFLVKEIPEEEVDCEADFVEDTYTREIIRYLESKGIEWDSIFVDSIHTDKTYIPLEFSAYYEIDSDNIFDIEILGVMLKASVSAYKG